MKSETSSGIVVFRGEGDQREYLLLGRQEGFLDFPKGHIEPGESEREAAIRETEEESGLRVEPLDGFRNEMEYWFRASWDESEGGKPGFHVSEYARKRTSGELIHKKLIMFLGMAPQGVDPHVSVEHTGFRWLSYANAMGLLKYRNQKELLEEAETFLNSHAGR